MNLVEFGISPSEATKSASFKLWSGFRAHERRSPIETQRSYSSLLDRIDFTDAFQSQPYEGSLNDVLNQLEVSLSEPDSNSRLAGLVLQPPRIIRAVIDYKIGHPEYTGDESEMLLREAISLGLAVYGGKSDVAEHLKRFRAQVTELGMESMLTNRLVQQSDGVTWYATQPEKSESTARQLGVLTNQRDLLFIALAHGGVAAGLDVYLRYCAMTGRDSSEFYAVRFSHYKQGDKQPQLTPSEVQYLQKLAKGRNVVIFDEDRASGGTLDKARAFFASQVFPSQPIVAVTNLDVRSQLADWGVLGILDPSKVDSMQNHFKIKDLFEEKIMKSALIINKLNKNENFKIIKPSTPTDSHLGILDMPEFQPRKRSVRQILAELEGAFDKPHKGI